MFEAVKIHKKELIDLEGVCEKLVEFGYERTKAITEEGDFSVKGENLLIYPVTFEYPLRVEMDGSEVGGIKTIDRVTYKAISEHQSVMILPIKGMLRRKIYSRKRTGEENPIDSFVDIRPSDYVVHVDYGIGKYLGMERVGTKKGARDHMVIEYKGGDRLYVPFGELNKVQRYIAFEKKPPKLYRMGSVKWAATKEKARAGASRVAFEILEIQARRKMMKGYAYSGDTDWQKLLEGSFPFEETDGQIKATSDVKSDMESKRPMDRLLCGDVGYGKTEVALRAAFKAVMDNRQVAILVPTTILAEQHYTTFTKRMKDFPVDIQMLSRFKTRQEQKDILGFLKNGKTDIVIGTHRLLSPDVKLKNLGLLIIDEEQRFGVKHKEKLKRMRLVVDVLTLTATPIPRTLYLALMGGRDISVIDTPPLERLPVTTSITDFDERLLRSALEHELNRGGQVYFVHNRIYGIEKLRERIHRLLPRARTAVMHGRMGERELEKTMTDFIKGEIDILVSTTIIESGIDIPNANTIIINRADTFGLADLYQLRGRVGRFRRRAFCYLVANDPATLPGDVKNRLETIKRYQELGSGFKIAMQDLEMRGAGNILGVEQHGFISNIGFDLYCRQLRDAIELFKKSA